MEGTEVPPKSSVDLGVGKPTGGNAVLCIPHFPSSARPPAPLCCACTPSASHKKLSHPQGNPFLSRIRAALGLTHRISLRGCSPAAPRFMFNELHPKEKQAPLTCSMSGTLMLRDSETSWFSAPHMAPDEGPSCELLTAGPEGSQSSSPHTNQCCASGHAQLTERFLQETPSTQDGAVCMCAERLGQLVEQQFLRAQALGPCRRPG